MAPKKTALEQINIAKQELGLTDEAYRDILSLKFQVNSVYMLNDRQATVLLNTFKAKGWKPKRIATSPARGRKRNGKYIETTQGTAAK